MLNILVVYVDFLSSNVLQYLISSKIMFIVYQVLSLEAFNLSDKSFDVALFFLPKQISIDYLLIVTALLACSKPVLVIDPENSMERKSLCVSSGCVRYFSAPVLISALDTTLRSFEAVSNQVVYEDLCLNLFSRQLFYMDSEIQLSRREYELMLMFMRNVNKVFTKDQILMEIWFMKRLYLFYLILTMDMVIGMDGLRILII